MGISLFNTLIYFAGRSTTSVNMSLISISLVISGVLILITKGKLSSLLTISFAPGDALILLAALTAFVI
ncbi:MAG: hypothetical protein WA234_11020 [Rectinemataceae bacterium]